MWNIKKFREETSALVNIDSGSNDLDGVEEVCRKIEKWFLEENLFVETFDCHNRILAKTHNEEDFDIMFIGHMDTVFPKGTSKIRPYAEKSGFAYGPGVADMKSGLVMCLHLIRKLKISRPDLKICIAFSGDEETGSLKSKSWFQSLAKHTKFAFVFEPGRNDNCFIRSRKGCMDINVTFHGKSAHAGVSPQDGANAILEASNWIIELSSMQNLDFGTSINAGIIQGGTASNVVPDFTQVKFDVRVKNISELERIKTKTIELQHKAFIAGVSADVEFIGECPPMNPSESALDLINKLNYIASELNLTANWIDSGGVSDANNIAILGIPTICGCGPCGGKFHSDDEFIILSSIKERLDIMYNLLIIL